MTYSQSIEWLFSTQLFGIKLGLEGPTRLLKEYLAFPSHDTKVIHVAGTNGKGSTCALIDALARASGSRVGLFTSPHLIDFRERIRVSGLEIPEDACAEMLTELRELCASLDPHPTFFEITLALGMRWFRKSECEVIVLETGMGGRFDATTAVPADVCAITPVGLDHTQWLGDTLEKIAVEKAGIFVAGKPAFSSPQESSVHRVLEMEANERRCPLTFINAPLTGYPVALSGSHQRWNAALALECAHAVGLRLDYEVVMHAFSTVKWPGRFERILHENREVILDGAHNRQGAGALVDTWSETFGGEKAVLVFSAVAGKDCQAILSQLCQIAAKIHFCPVDTPRAMSSSDLRDFLPEDFRDGFCHDSFSAAFDAALSDEGPILIAGSLFLIGEAKAQLQGGDFQSSTQ